MQRLNLHCLRQRIRRDRYQTAAHLVITRRFPAFNPGIRINLFRFAGADVIVQRRADKAVLKRGEQRRLLIDKPLRQFAAVA